MERRKESKMALSKQTLFYSISDNEERFLHIIYFIKKLKKYGGIMKYKCVWWRN